MQKTSNKDSLSSLTIKSQSDQPQKFLRIYYDSLNYNDIPLCGSITSGVYFIKQKTSYETIKGLFTNCFAKFIDSFTDDDYLNFVQIKKRNSLFARLNY